MKRFLFSKTLSTPLGEMLAVADKQKLFLLSFINGPGFEKDRRKLEKIASIEKGDSPVLQQIEKELTAFFQGDLETFSTPIEYLGTLFQKKVWEQLQKIPFGQTRSYREIAAAIGRPTAYRAVARANATNCLPLIIPCHRVISSDGGLSGYAGGVEKKQWLIQHEKRNRALFR